MFKDAVAFDQFLCPWYKNPNVPGPDFCVNSSCGECFGAPFPDLATLRSTLDTYCANPSGWASNSLYSTYG